MKKIVCGSLVVLFTLAVGGVHAQGSSPERPVSDISLADLKQAMADKAVVLIDCNGSQSYANSHIPGAIDFDAAGADFAVKLPKDKETLVVSYCAGPGCLAYKAGADAATKLGYTNVKYFSRGISGWNENDGAKAQFEQRLDYREASPAALNAMVEFSAYTKSSELDPELINLVFMRTSQINRCAWCLNMHTKDAKAAGWDEQRLTLLPVWRDVPAYTEREMAALAWTEAITLIAEKHVPDDVYETARKQFTEKELVDLTTVIIDINGWNRLNIAFKTPVMCGAE